VAADKATFVRPIVDSNFQYANPGARARFVSDSTYVVVRLRYTGKWPTIGGNNAVGAILVDGALSQTFTSPAARGIVADKAVALSFGSAIARLIEVVLPYGEDVDFIGIDVLSGSTLSPAPARPATRYVALGDSITHGFSASDVLYSWVYKLAAAKNWQLINCGYGGRRVTATDGTAAGNLNPGVMTYLIGYNDFTSQTPLATFKSTFKSAINNVRAVKPSIKIHCITPTWTPNTNALTIENYRQQIRDALTELANPLNVLIEGNGLATNSTSHFPDGIHPNDAGSDQIATALTSFVSA
jgi:lysophospholipase L1-like esterase